jgi:hypothetical protein
MTGGENTIFAASSLAGCAADLPSSLGKPRINQMRRRARLSTAAFGAFQKCCLP